jgi:hypothetical protein
VNTASSRLIMRFIVVATVLLASVSQSAWATNFFTWHADSTSTSAGNCSLQGATLDTTEKHQGSASMKLIFTDSQNQIGCPIDYQGTFPCCDGKWRYYRWWMKFDPSFTWGTTGDRKSKANRTLPTNAGFTGYIRRGSIYLDECSACSPATPGVAVDLEPADGGCVNSGASCTEWTEYIVGIKKQTSSSASDAEFHLWINGIKHASQTGIKIGNGTAWSGSTWEAWMQWPLPQLNSGGTGGGRIWVDDISVDDTWNSTVGPQPNPPTLLPVQ